MIFVRYNRRRDETRREGAKGQILARPSGPTGGVRRAPGSAVQHERRKVIRGNNGDLGRWLHAEGRVYVSVRERVVSNEGRPPCRRNAGGPELRGPLSARPGPRYNQTEADARILSYARMPRLLGQVVNSYLEWQLNFVRPVNSSRESQDT